MKFFRQCWREESADGACIERSSNSFCGDAAVADDEVDVPRAVNGRQQWNGHRSEGPLCRGEGERGGSRREVRYVWGDIDPGRSQIFFAGERGITNQNGAIWLRVSTRIRWLIRVSQATSRR